MADTRWLSTDEQSMWRALLEGFALLRRQLERDLAEHGLTIGDYEILVRLSETTDRHVLLSQLADQLVFSRSRLSHQVAKLEAAGLVRREPCGHDRRAWHVVLTARGRRRLEAAAPAHVEGVRRYLFDNVAPSQVRAIRAAFEAIADDLRSAGE